jgi:hypothetical protein
MDLTLYNSDVFLELHHGVSDFILINLMCHMALLSSAMELSMLTLDMLDMDLTLYNFDVFLELQHSVSDIILINLMCHMCYVHLIETSTLVKCRVLNDLY